MTQEINTPVQRHDRDLVRVSDTHEEQMRKLKERLSLPVASEALKHADFPEEAWVTVPVTHTLDPKQRWYDERMSATDLEPIKRYAKQQIRDAEKALEAEVAAFRNELKARQMA
jgi:hypothetical protein